MKIPRLLIRGWCELVENLNEIIKKSVKNYKKIE